MARRSHLGLAEPLRSVLERGLERFVASARKFPDVRAVYVFGSLARGDVGVCSDLDVLGLTPAEFAKRGRGSSFWADAISNSRDRPSSMAGRIVRELREVDARSTMRSNVMLQHSTFLSHVALSRYDHHTGRRCNRRRSRHACRRITKNDRSRQRAVAPCFRVRDARAILHHPEAVIGLTCGLHGFGLRLIRAHPRHESA